MKFRVVITMAPEVPRGITALLNVSSQGDEAKSPHDYEALSELLVIRAEDYVMESGSLVGSKEFVVPVYDDSEVEGTEHFRIALSLAIHWPADVTREIRLVRSDGTACLACHIVTYEVEILDDDAYWSFTASPTLIEEAATSEAEVKLETGGVAFEVDRPVSFTIAGTATAGVDFTVEDSSGTELSAPYSALLVAGEDSVSLVVKGKADTIIEEVETVEIQAVVDDVNLGIQQTLSVLDTTSQIAGLTVVGSPAIVGHLDGSPRRAKFELCWTPSGVETSELDDFEVGWTYYFPGETHAWPDSSDGDFGFRSVEASGSCNSDEGIEFVIGTGPSDSLFPDLRHHFRVRAKQGTTRVQSNVADGKSGDIRSPFKVSLLAPLIEEMSLPGEHPDGRPILEPVPDPVDGPFIVAVRAGSWVGRMGDTEEVEDFTLPYEGFIVTNATLSWPSGVPEYEHFVGYRLLVTPTTMGEDVSVQVAANAFFSTDAITIPFGEGLSVALVKNNAAPSNIIRRSTSVSSDLQSSAQQGSETERLPRYPVPVVQNSAEPPEPDAQTLVSNFGGSSDGVHSTTSGRRLSVKFSTGDATFPWTFDSIGLQVAEWEASVSPKVELRRINPASGSSYTIATLTNPDAGSGMVYFGAPRELKLVSNRTYSVVIGSDAVAGSNFSIRSTGSDEEDDGHSDGWSIANTATVHNGGRWSTLSGATVKLSVFGTPDTAESLSPLTARIELAPASHQGDKFDVLLGFSERIDTKYRQFQKNGFQVSGGRVSRVSRVSGWDDLWRVRVVPEGFEDVTLTVLAGRPCDAPGPACTRDGRVLSESVSVTVPVAPALSVSDASGTEGADESLVFSVTLDKEWTEEVTVKYETSDGTATEGSDYTKTSGTLAFAAGETEKTVEVPVVQDSEIEGSETFSLTLSEASGAMIADGEGVGTIEDDDSDP